MPSNSEAPRRRTLSRGKIFASALRLVDEHGTGALNMRRIADDLGVRPSALYRHVSGKDEILAGIRLLIGEKITMARFGSRPWDEELLVLGRRYRDAFAEHPNAVPLLATTPFASESSIIMFYDEVLRLLMREGWSGAEALDILTAFDSFLLGSALDFAAEAEVLDPRGESRATVFRGAFEERQARNAGAGRRAADSAFDAGLEIFIDGLRAALERRGTAG